MTRTAAGVLLLGVAIVAVAMAGGPAGAEAAGPGVPTTDAMAAADGPGGTAAAVGAATADRDVAVLWRGFKHAWSYNHRFNRIGSEVRTGASGCDRGFGENLACAYTVEHSGASGSGRDDAMFRDAYTELSASGVAFHTADTRIDLEGYEDADQTRPIPGTLKNEVNNRPDLAAADQTFAGTETITVDLESARMADRDEHVVLLNGFDLSADSGTRAAKVKTFDLGVGRTTRYGDDLVVTIEYELLFDCDTPECKGGIPRDGVKRAGNHVQEVDYTLDVSVLVAGGSDDTINLAHVDAPDGRIGNAYDWDECANNQFGDDSKHDKWNKDAAKFPDNRMYCEATEDRELRAGDHWVETTIDGEPGYSVGTVGLQRLQFDLEEEAHFSQYDTVVGGSYDGTTGDYDLRALPFFKEWTARPGEYEDAWGAMGHAGRAEVSATPVLLQLRDGCKRGVVSAGGATWATSPGDELDAASRQAVTAADHRFTFGEHWRGHFGNGNQCAYDGDATVDPPSEMAFQDWDGLAADFWSRQERVDEDPTSIRSMPSDRYYGDSPSSPTSLDLTEVTVEAIARTGDRGNVPLIDPGFGAYHAGTFVGGVTFDVDEAPVPGRVGFDQFLHVKDTGEIRRLNSAESAATTRGFIVDEPGDYAVVVRADRLRRLGAGGPPIQPAIAVIEFRVLEDPDAPRGTMSYRFEGGDGTVISYDWNADRSRWEWIHDDRSDGRTFHGQEPKHVFNGSVTPTVSPEPLSIPPDAYHEYYLLVDGQNVRSGEPITDAGNHTFTLYACHNTVGANCNEESIFVDRDDEDEDRSGPTKGGDGSGGQRLSGGVVLVAEHTLEVRSGPAELPDLGGDRGPREIDTGSDVDDPGYADALEDVSIGPDVPWLLDDELVAIQVEGGDDPTIYTARVNDGTIRSVEPGEPSDPTVRVTTDEETAAAIASSDDRAGTFEDRYDDGDVTVEGVGTVNRLKVGVAKVGKGLYDTLTGFSW